MQATPNNKSSTIKLTTTSISNSKLTPVAQPFGSILKPTTNTKVIKTSISKRTATATGTATANLSSSSSLTTSAIENEFSSSKEIEEISKKISDHADAIYRTWKYRGLAPTELLDIYTNAAAVQAQQGGGDIFGVSAEAAAAVNTTEDLQQLVNQFVIKDKEQRGVVKKVTLNNRPIQIQQQSTTKTSTTTTTGYIGGSHNYGQRTESTTYKMPENIGSKMTQKSSVVGSGIGIGGISALKHTSTSTRATGIQKPTITSSSILVSPIASASSTAILTKSNTNNKHSEQASVKKLTKSSTSSLSSSSSTTSPSSTPSTSTSLLTTSTSSSLSAASATSSKYNACAKNVNSGNSNIGGTTKNNSTPTMTTNATTPTTVKRSLGKTAITTASTVKAAAPTLDINLNLDLGFDDLQLDVNSLGHLQTQNLKKIKAFLKENERHEHETTTTLNKEPKKTATTTKIATKSKRINSTAKPILTEVDGATNTTATKTKTNSKSNLMQNEQHDNISNNNNNNSKNNDVVVNVKKIAKSLNLNNKTSNIINNNNKINSNNCIGETNDDATISKLISTNDKIANSSTTKSNSSLTKQQAGAKNATTATTPSRTTAKSTIEKSPILNASSTSSSSSPPTTNTTTTTALLASASASSALKMATNVGERECAQQSIKVLNSISNGSQADQKQLHNEENDIASPATIATMQKSSSTTTAIKTNKKEKDNSGSSSNKKSNESELKKSIKTEKINGSNNSTAAPALKAAIAETAAATATVIEMAQQQRANSNSASITANSNTNGSNISNNSAISNSSGSASNMPAPTKFKSGRAAPGAAPQDKNINRPFLTRGSVAERVLMFEKCPDVRNSFLNIKRPDPADAPPKSLLKVKLHATPPSPQEQRTLQQEIRSLKSVYIPRFYFPHGKPQPQIAQERTLRNILSAFDSFPNNQVTKDELPRILKLCGLPFYWRMPVMVYCQQQSNTGLVERSRFVEFWKQMNVYCHDAASRFVYILSRGQRFRSFITPEDLVPLVQDVVDTHPGLAFLKEATEFHSRYVHTVIARIFYSVNRSWSGKMTMSELKKSDLLEIISLLEEEDDINQIMAFFSYEHFYVIYCKFWELDKDHDLLINQDDLARHSDHALSTRIVERIFSGCVTRSDNKKNANEEPKMSYTDFVWFLLSEEDKRTPTAIEYWFRCMDLDGDGMLSMYELEYFYEEQQQRMESIGIETLPFEDCLCQMLDMIKPQRRDAITLGDLKRCKMTHVFFDTFFNLEKYLDHEQRDPFASQRDEYTSDWDRFAAQEYELLISEEND